MSAALCTTAGYHTISSFQCNMRKHPQYYITETEKLSSVEQVGYSVIRSVQVCSAEYCIVFSSV